MSVAFVFLAFSLLLAVLASRSGVRRFVQAAANRALRITARGAYWFSRAANAAFSPRPDGGVSMARLTAWAALNAAAFFAVAAPLSPDLPGGQPGTLLIVCVVAATLHFLIISASLLKIHEDNDVLNGLISEGERGFADNSAVSNVYLVVLSVAFLVLYLAAAVQLLDTSFYRLIDNKPATTVAYVDYLLATLETLPLTNLLMIGATWLAGSATGADLDIRFTAGWGRIAAHAIFFLGSFFLIGLVALKLRQKRDTYRLIDKLVRASDEPDVHYLKARVARSPSFINPIVLRAAVTPTSIGNQLNAIDAAIQQEIFSFPLRFCQRLSQQKNLTIRLQGLRKAYEFIERHGDRFDTELATRTLVAMARHLSERRSGKQVTLGINRMMLSLLLRARSRAFGGMNFVDWRDRPALAGIAGRVLALAIEENGKLDEEGELQLRAIDVGLRYGIYELPLRLLERLAKFGREAQLAGVGRITAWLDADSEYFRRGYAEPLLKAVDQWLDEKQNRPQTELREAVQNLKSTVRRGERTYHSGTRVSAKATVTPTAPSFWRRGLTIFGIGRRPSRHPA